MDTVKPVHDCVADQDGDNLTLLVPEIVFTEVPVCGGKWVQDDPAQQVTFIRILDLGVRQ
jgi:hypothetical protein